MKTLILFFLAFSLSLRAQDGKPFFDLGDWKLKTKDYKGAIEAFSRCIELEPKLAEAYFNRGLAKNKLQDHYEAMTDFYMAIKLKPEVSPMAYCNIAFAKNRVGDHKGALADCNMAINADPKITEAYMNRAESKYFLKMDFCPDLKAAAELGDPRAIEFYTRDCKEKTK